MHFSKLSTLVAAITISSLGSGYAAPSYVQLIENTPNLSVLNTYVQKIPELKKFYNGLKDSTCFLTQNSGLTKFVATPEGQILTSQPRFITDLFTYGCATKRYPTPFTPLGKWVKTYLKDTIVTNLTDGQVFGLQQDGQKSTLISAVSADDVNAYLLQTKGYKPHPKRHQTSVVTKANIETSGGLAHIVDEVPVAPPNITVTAEILNLRGLLDILIAQTPDVALTLQALNGVTIIVFSNKAVKLLKAQYPVQTSPQALAVETYNAVNGAVYPDQFTKKGAKFKTVQGEFITFTEAEGTLFVDQFVVKAYQLTSNGALYIVDGVPLPPSYCGVPKR